MDILIKNPVSIFMTLCHTNFGSFFLSTLALQSFFSNPVISPVIPAHSAGLKIELYLAQFQESHRHCDPRKSIMRLKIVLHNLSSRVQCSLYMRMNARMRMAGVN